MQENSSNQYLSISADWTNLDFFHFTIKAPCYSISPAQVFKYSTFCILCHFHCIIFYLFYHYHFTSACNILLNPSNPMSDQDRIFPHNISTLSIRLLKSIIKKYQVGDYKLIQHKILRTKIMRITWQTVHRITNEILGKKGLNSKCNIHILSNCM